MTRLIAHKIAVLLIFTVLVGRLYQLQLVDNESSQLRYATGSVTTRYLPVRPLRGEVFASDGKTLVAESMPIYSVSIRPADLEQAIDQAGAHGLQLRTELFARLGQLLGITSTLTISPSETLESNPALLSDLNQGLGASLVAGGQRQTLTPALQLPVAPDQHTKAAELVRRYGSVLRYSGIEPSPAESESTSQALGIALAGFDSALQVTGTLVISPATSLRDDQALRADVQRLLGQRALEAAGEARVQSWMAIQVPPSKSMVALKLSQAYTNVATLDSPVATQLARNDLPGYQTRVIKQDVPHDIALILRENAASLPGVVVERDYRRRYPLSGQIASLSHLLGYTGRIDECQLTSRNPARSWVEGLLDPIGHAVRCGLLHKPIDPQYVGRYGLPRYLGDDRIGKDGVEASYESQLRGQMGLESVVVDALGRPVGAPQTVEPARDGNNLVLTIDVAFQKQVEDILRNWIQEGERRRLAQSGKNEYKRNYAPISSGVAIVTEINTGRILAMASWPSYDNNIWVDPARINELDQFYPSNPEARKEIERLAPLTNRAIAGQYPPGSTLKQFDASIVLQKGVITAETQIRDPGRLVLQSEYDPHLTYPFRNAIPSDRGWITVSDALQFSSNIFFMSVVGGNKDHVVNLRPEEQTIANGLKITEFANGLRWFGFGEPLGIKLAGEQPGRVPTPAWKQLAQRAAWTTGDTYNMAIGQGNMLVTPLQLVLAGAAVANNGILYHPQIVKAITDSKGQVVQEIQPEIARRVPIDPQHFAVVRAGMRRSVTEGANIAARDACSNLQIAGKTGTAEFGPPILVPNTDGSGVREERQTHAWFVGFAPYDNPQIEVVVLSEGTGSLDDGSATIAVPAVTQIMQAYFNVSPPNPLPRGCQQNLPPLPPRPQIPSMPTLAATSAPPPSEERAMRHKSNRPIT